MGSRFPGWSSGKQNVLHVPASPGVAGRDRKDQDSDRTLAETDDKSRSTRWALPPVAHLYRQERRLRPINARVSLVSEHRNWAGGCGGKRSSRASLPGSSWRTCRRGRGRGDIRAPRGAGRQPREDALHSPGQARAAPAQFGNLMSDQLQDQHPTSLSFQKNGYLLLS